MTDNLTMDVLIGAMNKVAPVLYYATDYSIVTGTLIHLDAGNEFPECIVINPVDYEVAKQAFSTRRLIPVTCMKTKLY